jgi:hypothetical protein
MEAVARRSLASGWRNAPGMALGGEDFMSDDTDFRARSDRAPGAPSRKRCNRPSRARTAQIGWVPLRGLPGRSHSWCRVARDLRHLLRPFPATTRSVLRKDPRCRPAPALKPDASDVLTGQAPLRERSTGVGRGYTIPIPPLVPSRARKVKRMNVTKSLGKVRCV